MRVLLVSLVLSGVLSAWYAQEAEGQTAYKILVGQGVSGEERPRGAVVGVRRLVSVYQRYISPLNGARCMFYPTCSEFFSKAISTHGLFWGTLMTVDRLVYRENRKSMRFYRPSDESRGVDSGRYFDPLYHNFILKSSDYLLLKKQE